MKLTKPPRLIRSHLPYPLFEKPATESGMKILVPLRNVKDTLVSYYEFYKTTSALGNFTGTWNDFFELFRNKQLAFGDYFDWVSAYWKASMSNKNIYFIKYEDLKRNPHRGVQTIADYFHVKLSEEQVDTIVNYTSFNEMKKNPSTNFFQQVLGEKSNYFRKGEVGDWKNYFSEEQNEYVDKLIEEQITSIGLNFDYE